MLQNYLACGGNSSQTVDFFSLNAYEWCGDSTYETSGYTTLQDEAQGYPVPIFFSETGCNTAPPRTFADQAAIFGSDMVNTWQVSCAPTPSCKLTTIVQVRSHNLRMDPRSQRLRPRLLRRHQHRYRRLHRPLRHPRTYIPGLRQPQIPMGNTKPQRCRPLSIQCLRKRHFDPDLPDFDAKWVGN